MELPFKGTEATGVVALELKEIFAELLEALVAPPYTTFKVHC